jgi:hypothetical protein
LFDERQKVVDDFGDGNVVNVQFIPLNEKEQQVERAFKLG